MYNRVKLKTNKKLGMNQLGKLIKERLNQLNVSEREMAIRCGISHSYLNQLIKGINPKTQKPISPTITVIEKLSKGLEMSASNIENAIRGHLREKSLTESDELGIIVGTNKDKRIPHELWEKMQHTQDFMACLGLDPSKYSQKDWKDLLDDLKLVVETHLKSTEK